MTTHTDLLHRLRTANAIEARAIWKEAMERGVMDALERAYAFGAEPRCCGGGPQWGHAWDCKTIP